MFYISPTCKHWRTLNQYPALCSFLLPLLIFKEFQLMLVTDIPTIWTTKFILLEDVLPEIPQVYMQLLSWHTRIVASFLSQTQNLYPKHTSSQIHYVNNLFCQNWWQLHFKKLQSHPWRFPVQLSCLILENFFLSKRLTSTFLFLWFLCLTLVWVLCWPRKGSLPVPHSSGIGGIWDGLILF
jgi:hypothetical protein